MALEMVWHVVLNAAQSYGAAGGLIDITLDESSGCVQVRDFSTGVPAPDITALGEHAAKNQIGIPFVLAMADYFCFNSIYDGGRKWMMRTVAQGARNPGIVDSICDGFGGTLVTFRPKPEFLAGGVLNTQSISQVTDGVRREWPKTVYRVIVSRGNQR